MKTMRSLSLLAFLAFGSAASAAPDTQAAARAIDAILEADWQKHGLKGNPEADDSTFVRRIYLDIVGRIPTTREAETFMNSKAADKRAKLIDHLLASEGYVHHSFNYWADVLRAQTLGNRAGSITGAAYVNYLKESLRTNKPYDKLVQEMIAAEGDSWDNGAIGYYVRDLGMPLDNMANTARVFLGTRVECAQCHNHPFDKWTQKQFFEMAAFTYPVQTNDYYDGSSTAALQLLREREKELKDKYPAPVVSKNASAEEKARAKKEAEKMAAKYKAALDEMRKDKRYVQEAITDVRNLKRYTSVTIQENRKLVLPHDYQYSDAKPKSRVEPATMYGHAVQAKPGETQIQTYARWLASKDNDRFNKVIANRLWKRAFGLALMEPLDEIMDSTVPMIPELQSHLESLIVSLNYDMKAYLRILYNTSAYQRQVTREEIAPGIVYHFPGPVLRRMTAEQMWDSFVTLINPNPDMPNEELRTTFNNRILTAKKINDSMEALTPEEILAGAEKSGQLYKDQAVKVRELQAKIAEARAKEDKEAANKYRTQLSKLQRETRTSVNQNLIIPGMKKLAKELGVVPAVLQPDSKNGGQVVAATGDSMSMMMDSMAETGDAINRIFLPGYDEPKRSREEEKEYQAAREAVWKEEAEFYGLDEKTLSSYYRARNEQTRNWVRAAELESPAPRGHYLREFGQSDREMIENANHEASVPQALAMMNGQLMPQIMQRHSQLMLTVSKAQYPDDKVEAIYKTVLSRKPTAREKEVWMKAQENGLADIEDLIFSLLNTQQFIFIQ